MSFYQCLSEDAPYLGVFSWPHIGYLLFTIVSCAAFLLGKDRVKAHKKGMLRLFFALTVLQMAILYTWFAVFTGFDLAQALPLQISRVAAIFLLVFCLTENRNVLDIVCYLSLFMMLAVVYPADARNFLHVLGIEFMLAHWCGTVFPFFAASAYGWRPSWKGFWTVSAVFTGYFLFVLLINPVVGGNYFFQQNPPVFAAVPHWIFSLASYFLSVGFFALTTCLYRILARRIPKSRG